MTSALMTTSKRRRKHSVAAETLNTSPHDISSMVTELHDSNTGLNIPQHAGHIATTSDDLPITDKATATQVARMSAKLSGTINTASIRPSQVVNAANIVKTTTGDKVTGWCICACHNPRRSERNGVYFVGGVSVPYDEFSVLGGRDKMAAVGSPMHGIYFCEVTSEIAT
jgi:hypothetical protein